jgi:hypothetical protein
MLQLQYLWSGACSHCSSVLLRRLRAVRTMKRHTDVAVLLGVLVHLLEPRARPAHEVGYPKERATRRCSFQIIMRHFSTLH